jgi:dipeptidyl aminopeptidase/acylaminoacyl peptidase
MRRAALAAAAFACLVSAEGLAQAPLPVEAFARLPAIESPMISPDGRRIAHLQHDGNGDFLVVREADGFAPLFAVDTGSVKARDVLWASDDVVILIASDASRVSGVRGQVEFTAPFGLVLSDELSIKQLMQSRRQATIGATIEARRRINPNTARIIGFEPDTGRLLIPNLNEDDEFDLYAVDPRNDRRRTAGRGVLATRDWVVDGEGSPIARIDYREHSDRFQVRVLNNGSWEVAVEETVEIPSLSVYGLSPEGELIIGAQLESSDRFSLHVLSVQSGQIERTYYDQGEYDVRGVILDPFSNVVAGARVDADTAATVWFDADLADQQRRLDATFPEEAAIITSWSRDRSRFLVAVESAAQPTVYYLYDAAARTMDPLGTSYPEAFSGNLATRQSTSYPARDDVMIPAYLTMADGLALPAPLVVLPHGGPEARDVGGFDWMAHFLASRGYVVLQPNFRGCSGYGARWTFAGRGEWGVGVMQHDISDGVAALIAEGIADPERVCIVGASYGGYAALAGAAFTPERYRCAAAIAPVSDLNGVIDYAQSRSGYRSWVVDYWREVIGGDLGSARDRLRAISPAHNAENVRAPILLIHGRRTMESALRGAGKDVTFVELRGEDHWLSRAETRLEAMQALESFLAAHLGG